MILKSYKVQLQPNNKQVTLFKQHIGCARWAYNWALSKKKESFDKKTEAFSFMDLHKELVKMKENVIPWMYNSSKSAPQSAIEDCDKAFKSFFRRCKQKTKGKKGFPKFKSKKNEKQSFRLIGCISVKSNYIKLPRIGKVKLTQKNYVPVDYKILSATVSKRAGKWFVSVNIEAPDKESIKSKNNLIGVDLGVKNLAACSDGASFENPKALSKNLKKLKRKQRQLSRKKKGSKNREKANKRLARLHYKISNIRKDALHKATTKIVNENQVIVLEDLKVSNMTKNRNLARAISDVGLSEFRRQIEYKAKWNNRQVIFVDTFYPSSKICSSCEKVKDLLLSERVYKCECGLEMDRDLNASLNLKNFGAKQLALNTVGLTGINASGDGSSGSGESQSYSLSEKEEFNINL